jgi:phenylacetate-CoA ligase
MIRYNLKSKDSKYWNTHIETMPRDKIKEIQFKKIKAIIRYAYEHSPMYRRLYDNAKVKPEDIKSFDDFIEKIPTIDKKDLLEAQRLSPPFGDLLTSDMIMQRYMTSGTAGIPMQLAYLDRGQIMTSDSWSSAFWAAGIRPSDTFYFAFNFGTFVGFWTAYWGAINLGGRVIGGGGLTTKDRINQILMLKPTVLLSTPTYALHMIEVAKEIGVDLRDSSIRITYHAGEPGANIPVTRRAIENGFGAKTYDFYGIGEIHGMAASCELQDRLHIFENQCMTVVVDRDGKVVKEGEVGENVVTSFAQLAQPIIKYRTHDLVEWHEDICECGRTLAYFKGGILGRTDNMIIIKGVNIYPTALESLLWGISGITENYEIHVTRDRGLDSIKIKVEADRELPQYRYNEIAEKLKENYRSNIGVNIDIEILQYGSLPRYELKSKRFFDHRKEKNG